MADVNFLRAADFASFTRLCDCSSGVEHRSVEPGVGGSKPPSRTKLLVDFGNRTSTNFCNPFLLKPLQCQLDAVANPKEFFLAPRFAIFGRFRRASAAIFSDVAASQIKALVIADHVCQRSSPFLPSRRSVLRIAGGGWLFHRRHENKRISRKIRQPFCLQ